jgi:3-methyladenine DNA glycosylase AlkD
MNVRSELLSLAEPDYQKYSASLLPGVDNILGVRIPKLRIIAKRIAKENWKEFLDDAKDDSFEEILLQGLVIGYAKANPTEIITALDSFVPKINNWSVCDSTAMTLKAAKNHPAFFGYADACLAEGTEFSVRFGIVLLMAHFVSDDYIDSVLEKIESAELPGYYAKMAAAWAVSVCYVKYPEKTEEWLASSKLDDWTFNKSIQKIKESYRVSAEDKNRLDSMKR